MKRFTGVICLIIVVSILLMTAGCGSKQEQITVDVNALSADIIGSGAYTDAMGQTSTEVALNIYGLDSNSVAEASVYFSSMATAEECAVFKATSLDDVRTIVDACQARVNSQIESYKNYVPEEVPKLNNASIITYSDYVILTVSNDNALVDNVLKAAGISK